MTLNYEETIILIRRFSNKAKTISGQQKANVYWRRLKRRFSYNDLKSINYEWDIFLRGGSPKGLEYECEMLVRKFEGNQEIPFENWWKVTA